MDDIDVEERYEQSKRGQGERFLRSLAGYVYIGMKDYNLLTTHALALMWPPDIAKHRAWLNLEKADNFFQRKSAKYPVLLTKRTAILGP